MYFTVYRGHASTGQVATYWRLKAIENSKTVSWNSGRGCLQEVVVCERFQYKALIIIIIIIITVYSQIQIGKWKGDKRGYPFLVYLLGTFLVFWEGGRLWRVVTCRRWSHIEIQLYTILHQPKHYILLLNEWEYVWQIIPALCTVQVAVQPSIFLV